MISSISDSLSLHLALSPCKCPLACLLVSLFIALDPVIVQPYFGFAAQYRSYAYSRCRVLSLFNVLDSVLTERTNRAFSTLVVSVENSADIHEPMVPSDFHVDTHGYHCLSRP